MSYRSEKAKKIELLRCMKRSWIVNKILLPFAIGLLCAIIGHLVK